MKIIGKKIIRYEIVDSTNDEAKRLIKHGEGEGVVVIAGCQTKGRGKPGSSWFSPQGEGLYLSAIVKPGRNVADLGLITFVVAEAVVAAIKSLTTIAATIKKPNDVLIDGKKVAGILVERLASGYLIIGIGLNVNNREESFPEDITQKATSLLIETGNNFEINQVFESLLSNLDDKYVEYLAKI